MCNIGVFESLFLKQRVLFGQRNPTSLYQEGVSKYTEGRLETQITGVNFTV